jgi:hypothetical protein
LSISLKTTIFVLIGKDIEAVKDFKDSYTGRTDTINKTYQKSSFNRLDLIFKIRAFLGDLSDLIN